MPPVRAALRRDDEPPPALGKRAILRQGWLEIRCLLSSQGSGPDSPEVPGFKA